MTLPIRLGVALLPDLRWPDAVAQWTRLDELGVDHLWTYDHLSWRDLRDGPWLGAMPLLGAMAAVTTHAQLGTLVASPNYRHPVPFAKEALTVAEISAGRFICGVGAGGTGWDSTVLGHAPWTRAERTQRFAEFTALLAQLFSADDTTAHGSFYSAVEAKMMPRQPIPLAVAATGAQGMKLAAAHADWWITFGHPTRAGDLSDDDCAIEVDRQTKLLEASCVDVGRAPSTVRRALLVGSTKEPWYESASTFERLAGRYAELGITDVIIHAPRANDPYAYDPAVFDAIIALR
jgi:alkanesulfonate monooxygenase SsuD/methylene tetrahydromethanopterin reductase-like flavin-dependent oxidoreductase (luciferase family)